MADDVAEQVPVTGEPEQTEADRAQEEADLLQAFTPDSAEQLASTPGESPAAEGQPAETRAETSSDEVVHLKRADYDKIMSTINGLDQRFGATFGKVGELEQRVRDMQKTSGAGNPVTLTDEDFQEMRADFPDLADMSKKALTRILSRVGAGGAGRESMMADVTKIIAEERGKEAQIRVREVFSDIDALRNDDGAWRKIVGIREHDNDPVPDTAYRRWMATKPKEYQDRIANTWNPAVIDRSIQLFEQETKKTTTAKPKSSPQPDPQRTRLAHAVTPKGAGAAGKAPVTEEDEMLAGFHGK